MNNSEAKKTILEADSCFCKHGAYKDCHSGCKYREALDAAVKALEQEPTTKNDLGVDAIARSEVLNRLASIAKIKAKSDAQKYNSNVIHKTINGETDPNEVEALDMAIKALEQETVSINVLAE